MLQSRLSLLKINVLVVAVGALSLVAAILLSGRPDASRSIPLPFGGGNSTLRGSITTIGSKGINTVTNVSFDNNETTEVLPVNTINFVLTPDSPTISHGAPLNVALTSGKRIFGYKYTSRDAATERANINAALFTQRFPGQFFVSGEQRSFDAFITTFERTNGVQFLPLSAVTLDRNARYIVIANDAATSVTVRGLLWCGNGVIEGSEACDDGNTANYDGCSNSCAVDLRNFPVPQPPENGQGAPQVRTVPMARLAEEFDVVVANRPSTILMHNEIYGPVKGDIRLRVSTLANPVSTLDARYVFEYTAPLQGNWILKESTVTGTEAALPLVEIPPAYSNDAGWPRKGLMLTSRTGARERVHVSIVGDASQHVRPVLLSEYRSRPFIGKKTILVLKGRLESEPMHNANDETSNAPYGVNNQAITEKLEAIERGYEGMSNGLVQVEYKIIDTTFSIDGLPAPPDWTVNAPCQVPKVTERMLASVGINQDNYWQHFDMVISSVYSSTAELLRSSHLRCSAMNESGMGSTQACPQCGPGSWISFGSEGILLPHGMGHGLGFAHNIIAPRCDNEPSGPSPITQAQLFSDSTGRTNCRYPTGNMYENAMTGNTYVYYDILDRSSLGWLRPRHVGLVTQTGIYDLYGEYADQTAGPDDPVVLNIPITVQGVKNSAYLAIPSYAPSASRYGPVESIKGNLEGVRLQGGAFSYIGNPDEPLANWISYYWYSNEHGPIPVGKKVHMLWEGTNVRVTILSLTRESGRSHAKVAVSFNEEPYPQSAEILPAPKTLPVAASSKRPTVQWETVPGAQAYLVRVYQRHNGLKHEAHVPAGQLSFAVPQDLSDFLYAFNVQAVDAIGTGGYWSDLQTFTVY